MSRRGRSGRLMSAKGKGEGQGARANGRGDVELRRSRGCGGRERDAPFGPSAGEGGRGCFGVRVETEKGDVDHPHLCARGA